MRGLSVGKFDREFSVWAEAEEPSAFVGEVVVFAAQGKEVGEVGGSAVAPPVHVVGFGVAEGDVASGDGAGGVDGVEGSSSGAVGESVGSSEVEIAVGFDNCAVAGDDP